MIIHNLRSIKLVDRIHYLQELCRGKRVLHLGATDAPVTKTAVLDRRLLHIHLEKVTDRLVGMDIDRDMISWLSKHCDITNIHYGNIEVAEDYPTEEFDYIVAGEIFEHLSNPGKALDSVRTNSKPFTRFVITVPNAYSFKGFCRAALKHELIHPDHTLHHSPYTLKSLLERHGFLPEEYFSFVNGGKGVIAAATNIFLRYQPQLAEGIGVVCRPA